MKIKNESTELFSSENGCLFYLTETEMQNTDGGVFALAGLIVGAAALSYQLFKFGFDLGREAAK
jgi:hypothetical protein